MNFILCMTEDSTGSGVSGSSCAAIDVFKIAEQGDVEMFLDAYAKIANFAVRDKKGNTILHIAAEKDQRRIVRAIIAFGLSDQLWHVKNNAGHTPIDVATQRVKQDMILITMTKPVINTQHMDLNDSLVKNKLSKPNNNYKVLLSIDGGGIKGNVVAVILNALHAALATKDPLVSRIHWIGGTSVGGILALLLASGMDTQKLRRMMVLSRKEIFCGNSKIFPKHDPSGIEQNLRIHLGAETTMSDLKNHKVMVTAAKITSAPSSLVLFRSYAPKLPVKEYEKYGYLDPDRLLAWKCARTTSAAPIYFESFHGMADGAIVCNNPCIVLMADFFRLKKLERYKGIENNDEIGCIISLGCGMEPVVPIEGIDINLNSKTSFKDYMHIFGKAKNLMTLVLYQCATSHALHVGHAREWAHSLGIPFFRFSPKLSRAVEVDNIDIDIIIDIMFETEVYLRSQVHRELRQCVELLKSMPRNTRSHE